jgi:enterochelin esterase-like enzyme
VRQAIRATLAVAGIWVWLPLAGCESARPEGTDRALRAVIAEVEAGRLATPLVGEPTAGGERIVTFLARRDGSLTPRIISDVTGWGEHPDGTFDFNVGRMMPVEGTAWYRLEAAVVPRARVEYLIAYGPADYRLDPHNARPALEEPPASEFVMPDYVAPEESADFAGAPAGRVADAVFESRAVGLPCRLAVYTPPSYRPDGDYPLAVFAERPPDSMPRVLDSLIARRAIEPIVAVFTETDVHRQNRGAPGAMRALLTRELPAWVATRYGVTRSAERRAIIGISFSAKDALDAALASSTAFGRLGLLIPGRRITPADIDAIAGRPTHHLRVAILAGRYDQANLATARSLRQALVEEGQLVDYVEVPEGHTPRTWRLHLREVLVSLFGPPNGDEQR